MKYVSSNIYVAAVLAVIITFIVRMSVFSDDCNLLVMGMTFLSAFVLVYLVIKIIRRIMACR